ncbi:MAG: alpha/beta fold hydrolase [Ferruginibacter sp.]
MQQIKNILVQGAGNRMMALDVFFEDSQEQKPVVVYAHGFNGFKDWGNFDIIAAMFAREGYVFIKFNFSHNGTTPEQPAEFADLEAFGSNNYTKELVDLGMVIDWICDPLNTYQQVMDTSNICLIGHSMGGGISILKAAEDKRVSKLITWAAISECKTPWGNWPSERMEEWERSGVQYYTNSRTKQEMPMYYQLYEDYIQNQERLDIKKAIQRLDIDVLICHGTLDTAVPVEQAHELKAHQPSAQLVTVTSDHVFDRKHPWMERGLPPAMLAIVEASLRFLR